MIIYKPQRDKLIVPISDSVTGFKREVEYTHLEHFTGANIEDSEIIEEHTKFLKVSFKIKYYILVEEEYTEMPPITEEMTPEEIEELEPIVKTKMVRKYVKSLSKDVTNDTFVADRRTLVNMENGHIICNLGEDVREKAIEKGYSEELVDSVNFTVGSQIDFFEAAFNRVDSNLPPEMQGLIPIKPMIYNWAQMAVFKDISVNDVDEVEI